MTPRIDTPLLTRLALPLALSASAVAQGPAPSADAICSRYIWDQATTDCIGASSVPAMGLLYPLSTDFNLDTFGRVGMGTASPNSRLHVNGDGAGGEDLLRVQRNGSTRLFLDADGQLGVGGFFDPFTELHVQGHTYSVNSASDGARGVEGYTSDTGTGSQHGVLGFAAGTNGIAVYGRTTAASGATTAIFGLADSPDGRGVYGNHSDTSGSAAGVEGRTASESNNAYGVYGRVSSSSAGSYSAGVRGRNNGTGGTGIGVWGSHQGTGWGVYGTAEGGVGVYGSSTSGGYGVYSAGDFAATGTKSFVQPHPTDPAKEIAFVCLEGNESGTYCRGEGAILDGLAVVNVPEDFRLASEAEGLTIQTTAIGAPAQLWVESIDLERVVVRADRDVTFHWFLNGVRRGFGGFQTIRENRSFRPQQGRGAVGMDLPPAARELLVQSGILNPDFTLNLDTAARLGWEVLDGAGSEAQVPEPAAVLPTPPSPRLEEH